MNEVRRAGSSPAGVVPAPKLLMCVDNDNKSDLIGGLLSGLVVAALTRQLVLKASVQPSPSTNTRTRTGVHSSA